MQTRWIDVPIDYDGSQLRAHWVLRRFGIVGDAMVGFVGACRVIDDEMADLEDLGGPGIAGSRMLHFLWESFDEETLRAGVVRQRLMTCIVREVLETAGVAAARLRRDGDDLFVDDRKLTISIATRSPVSALLHFALNVDTAGTPVPTAGLRDLSVDAVELGRAVLDRVRSEFESIERARVKVRAKGATFE